MPLSEKHLESLKTGRATARQNRNAAKCAIVLSVKQKESLKAVTLYAPSQVNVFHKAFMGGKAAAIKAKCLQCVCNQRKEVETCEIEGCALWAVRPYRKRGAK